MGAPVKENFSVSLWNPYLIILKNFGIYKNKEYFCHMKNQNLWALYADHVYIIRSKRLESKIEEIIEEYSMDSGKFKEL